MLDIDYSLTKPQNILLDQTMDWVNKAHDNVETTFEGCISDPLRELFEIVR